jgi:hypothetical protein
VVDAEPGRHRGEKRLRRFHDGAVGDGPVVAQEGILHDVLGFHSAAQHAVAMENMSDRRLA